MRCKKSSNVQVGGPGLPADVAAMIAEMRDNINHVKRDMTNGRSNIKMASSFMQGWQKSGYF